MCSSRNLRSSSWAISTTRHWPKDRLKMTPIARIKSSKRANWLPSHRKRDIELSIVWWTASPQALTLRKGFLWESTGRKQSQRRRKLLHRCLATALTLQATKESNKFPEDSSSTSWRQRSTMIVEPCLTPSDSWSQLLLQALQDRRRMRSIMMRKLMTRLSFMLKAHELVLQWQTIETSWMIEILIWFSMISIRVLRTI